MRDVDVELKALRLHGMASAWAGLVAQGSLASLESARWLIEQLLQAETTHERRRVSGHRDLAGFDFASSKVDRALVEQLAELSFTDGAHNAVFIGGPGTDPDVELIVKPFTQSGLADKVRRAGARRKCWNGSAINERLVTLRSALFHRDRASASSYVVFASL